MIEIVFPDSGPLISLAKINRLDLIDRFQSQILITDAVEIEIMEGPEGSADMTVLSNWIKNGGNKIQVVETAYGELLKQNRELLKFVPEEQRSQFRRRGKARNAGENAIREFADEIRNTLPDGASALVLFEDNRVRSMNFGDHVRLMTTWSFVVALENLDVIPSANDLFDQIEATGRRPPRDPFDRAVVDSRDDFRSSYDHSEP